MANKSGPEIGPEWQPVSLGTCRVRCDSGKSVLFSININDIDDIVKLIEIIRKFADDKKLGQKAASAKALSGRKLEPDTAEHKTIQKHGKGSSFVTKNTDRTCCNKP